MLPGDDEGLSDPYEIRERLEHELDLVIDAGIIEHEETTMIVLRVVADPALYARIAADGVDPFSRRRQAVVADRPLTGMVELRLPRAHFADFPRTELRLYAGGASAAAAAPRLIVFYLGVPDTTPEFANEATLAAYLADRSARLAAGGSKSP